MNFIYTEFGDYIKIDSISAIEFKKWKDQPEIVIVLDNGREYLYNAYSDEAEFLKGQSSLLGLLRKDGLNIIEIA